MPAEDIISRGTKRPTSLDPSINPSTDSGSEALGKNVSVENVVGKVVTPEQGADEDRLQINAWSGQQIEIPNVRSPGAAGQARVVSAALEFHGQIFVQSHGNAGFPAVCTLARRNTFSVNAQERIFAEDFDGGTVLRGCGHCEHDHAQQCQG